MPRPSLPRALALVAALAACRTEEKVASPGRSPDEGGAGEATGPDSPDSRRPRIGRRPRGAGHTSNIDRVALSADGKAALTRDAIGATRLWPALDGSREPIPLPVSGAQSFSVERASKGWTVFAVDASGGGKIITVGDGGEIATSGELPPFNPLFEGHVLAGGERVLVLFRDHTIRLLSIEGVELARVTERRFRPTELRVAADGRTALAILETRVSATEFKSELQPLRVGEGNKPQVALDGSPRIVKSTVELGPTTGSLSPDGKRFALVDKFDGSGSWEILMVDLRSDAEQRFKVPIPGHTSPGVGFTSRTELLSSANDGGLSWLVEIERGATHARTAPAQDFMTQVRPQAFAGGVHAASHGTWLFVHDVDDRSHHFLGYRTLQAQSIAVSPAGKSVATAYFQGPLYVESLDEGDESVKLPNDPFQSVFRVRFLDEDRLLTVDVQGGIQLLAWRTGEVLASAGVNGSVRSMHFEPQTGILLVDRHSHLNDSRIFEVTTKGIAGPYIVADQSFRTGLLLPAKVSHKDAVLWTLDSSNKTRFYTLAELRSDLSADEVKRKGQDLKAGQIAPLAIDRLGRHYGVRWNGSAMELFIDDGAVTKSKRMPAGDVSEIFPSADGESFLTMHQRGGSVAIAAHDRGTLEERWSYSTGTFNNEVTWSPDGRYVGIAAASGAVVLDARTGKPVNRRCGLEFEALGAPPSSAFQNLGVRSLCEP